jgi:hypothetical protein
MQPWLPHPLLELRQKSGPTDLFLPIAANLFLMILVLMAKGSPDLARRICGILRSQLNTEEYRHILTTFAIRHSEEEKDVFYIF